MMMLTSCDWLSPLSWMTLIGFQGFFQLRGTNERKSTATRAAMELLDTLFDFNKRDGGGEEAYGATDEPASIYLQ
jgi:hypothetical protein